jgi:hypothetical protein
MQDLRSSAKYFKALNSLAVLIAGLSMLKIPGTRPLFSPVEIVIPEWIGEERMLTLNAL